LKATGLAYIVSYSYPATITSPNNFFTVAIWAIKFYTFIIWHNMSVAATANW